MKINPGDPAYPVVLAPHEGRDGVEQSYKRGIPIRLEIAARIMGGWAANERHKGHYLPKDDAEYCLSISDALIAAYNASEPE